MQPRTPARRKAKELAKYLRGERPDYNYLRNVFKYLRAELEVEVTTKQKKLPYVPTEEELLAFYKNAWVSKKKLQDVIILRVFFYTGVRVSELCNIQIYDVDLDTCQIRINEGKGKKDRIVPFPADFKETLALHIEMMKGKGAIYLFESSWKKKYSDRTIRKMIAKYSTLAGLPKSLSPHKLRHFFFTWLKRQGIDDALIQPYSGHDSRKSLEIYSKLSITDAQKAYDGVINKFPI